MLCDEHLEFTTALYLLTISGENRLAVLALKIILPSLLLDVRNILGKKQLSVGLQK